MISKFGGVADGRGAAFGSSFEGQLGVRLGNIRPVRELRTSGIESRTDVTGHDRNVSGTVSAVGGGGLWGIILTPPVDSVLFTVILSVLSAVRYRLSVYSAGLLLCARSHTLAHL